MEAAREQTGKLPWEVQELVDKWEVLTPHGQQRIEVICSIALSGVRDLNLITRFFEAIEARGYKGVRMAKEVITRRVAMERDMGNLSAQR